MWRVLQLKKLKEISHKNKEGLVSILLVALIKYLS